MTIQTVAPGVWRLRFGEPETITPLAMRRSVPAAEGLAALPVVNEPPLDPQTIRFEAGARGGLLTLPFDPEEGVFGFGLQLKSHLQNGKKKTVRVNSDPPGDTGDSHAPLPFYLSTRGYGVLVDTARYAAFYVGTHAPAGDLQNRACDKETVPQLSTGELYRRHAFGRTVAVDIPHVRGVDVYLFGGPGLREALRRYVHFSGGGCLPPLWGLGNWYRAHARQNAADVLALVREFREERLPFTVIGLEPGWQTHSYPNSLVWSERFPDPAAFAAELAGLGCRLNLWEHAFLAASAPFAREIAPYCGDTLGMDGLVPDFLCPEATRLFEEHHAGLIESGVCGFKLDECDNSDFISYSWSFPEHSRFPGGADGEQMHALFGVLYQEVVDRPFRQVGRRHYGLARSSGLLAASLPYALYSDLYQHEDFLQGLVNAGFGGLLWCPEVRHAASVEDLVRRLQTAVLSPLSQVDAWYIPRPPWYQIDRRLNGEGVEMPERAEATVLVREALELRMRLLPVLYTAFAKYHRDGLPPFRALAVDFPGDKQAWSANQQFLIGDHLLAAPLKAGEREKAIYLPAGLWREFETGRVHAGGKCLVLNDPPLSHIPLYVRDGAILPLAEPGIAMNDAKPAAIRAHVYADTEAEGDLYEDDGVTHQYLQGKAAWHRLSWRKGEALTVTGGEPGPLFRLEAEAVIKS